LKGLGVRIAIDDFGTGFSSLDFLRRFSVDCLKIDRSFVQELAHNPRDRAVAVAISDMGRALGMSVVAEGVETDAQARFFAGVQCNELQGYLFCHPMPLDQVQRYLDPAPGRRTADTPEPPAANASLQAG